MPLKDKHLPLKNNVKRFDFVRKVKKSNAFYRWLKHLVAKIVMKKYHSQWSVSKDVKSSQLKSPYLVLSTHMSFIDMPMLVSALPDADFNIVCAIDGFKDFPEWLLRNVGCIGKRKFVNDLNLVRNLSYSAQNYPECSIAVYPEAKYSIDGCTSFLPDTLGKLAKFLDIPIVVVICHGDYISDPQWRHQPIVCKTNTEVKVIVDQEEIKTLSAGQIQQRIIKGFQYDEFKWWKDQQIKVDLPTRADGLHRILYQCPNCKKEFLMSSHNNVLHCDNCNKEWLMDEYGQLKATTGTTEFCHIPDWFNWQKENIKKEIASGKYYFEDKVRVRTLPNSKRFYNHGEGTLVHSKDGFKLVCEAYNEPTTIVWEPINTDGCHIEYNYKGEADAIDLSIHEDSYWLYPLTARNVVTKISLATDEFFRLASEKLKAEHALQAVTI